MQEVFVSGYREYTLATYTHTHTLSSVSCQNERPIFSWILANGSAGAKQNLGCYAGERGGSICMFTKSNNSSALSYTGGVSFLAHCTLAWNLLEK